MSDHLALCVDRLIPPDSLESIKRVDPEVPIGEGSSQPATSLSCAIQIEEAPEGSDSRGLEEDKPLLQTGECRICQEEDSIDNMETPCACSGSLKFAHRKCVQQWCNEKGDIKCEICHQSYQPGYTAPPPPPLSDDDEIDIAGVWTISGTPFDPRDPRNLAFAAAERRLLEAEYGEYAENSASGAAFCRSAALILMALLLLRHALSINGGEADDEDDASALFSLFLLRVAGFLLPCYIMAWAISILQRRRQRQEAAALAANEVAFMIRAAHQRGLRFTIAPGGALTPLQESHQSPV
ncbi:uncharacterized protein LOC116189419 [Punica granatum]|uniref:Uncharacterized protein LOC116189419 n=2 Tax=Punica granatum TaxID=22663 RepID=A0A6P8C0K1_PUNGR|nr:uncharacterized protein LOC116189419 [Punica granatum]XP_031374933.1 uncharacterized protein LOC116189419 [Punica granatum]PKI77985.1 hypothetical protein CRG98_001605 [Punica granatum]